MRSIPGLAVARNATSRSPVILQSSAEICRSDQSARTVQRGLGAVSSVAVIAIVTFTSSPFGGESTLGLAVGREIVGGWVSAAATDIAVRITNSVRNVRVRIFSSVGVAKEQEPHLFYLMICRDRFGCNESSRRTYILTCPTKSPAPNGGRPSPRESAVSRRWPRYSSWHLPSTRSGE